MEYYRDPNRFIIEEDGAWAGVAFEPKTDVLRLNYIFVPEAKRGRGVGRSLLRQVVALAQEQGAYKITAEIISPEFLSLSQAYFGEEAVKAVRDEGARADLEYYLPRNNEPAESAT